MPHKKKPRKRRGASPSFSLPSQEKLDTPAGNNFAQSVSELFDEAKQMGFITIEDFESIKEKIIKLLVASGSTTAARARANNPVTLPDGREPQVDIGLPPSQMKVNETNVASLRQTSSPIELTLTIDGLVREATKPAAGNRKRSVQEQSLRENKKRNTEASSTTLLSSVESIHPRQGHGLEETFVLKDQPAAATEGGGQGKSRQIELTSYTPLRPSRTPNIQERDTMELDRHSPEAPHTRDCMEKIGESSEEQSNLDGSSAPQLSFGHDEPMHDVSASLPREELSDTSGETMNGHALMSSVESTCNLKAWQGSVTDTPAALSELENWSPLREHLESQYIVSGKESSAEGAHNRPMLQHDFMGNPAGPLTKVGSQPHPATPIRTTEDEDIDTLNSAQVTPKKRRVRLVMSSPTDDDDSEGGNFPEQLATLSQEIMCTDASEWEAYKPRLMHHVRLMGLGMAAPSASVEPEYADTPLKRLNALLGRLDDDIMRIPAANWENYKSKLTAFCTSGEIQGMDQKQLLQRIGRIIYLPEELEVLKDGDWNRLESVVRLVALVAEVTAFESEQVSCSISDRWIKSKLQDFKFLKMCLSSQARIKAVALPTGGGGCYGSN